MDHTNRETCGIITSHSRVIVGLIMTTTGVEAISYPGIVRDAGIPCIHSGVLSQLVIHTDCRNGACSIIGISISSSVRRMKNSCTG